MWPYGDLPLDRVWFLSFVLNRVHNLRAGGVLLGILGEGVLPGFPNPDPISDQKNVIFHTYFQTRPLKSIPFFRPGH